jgi:hypothetical protein
MCKLAIYIYYTRDTEPRAAATRAHTTQNESDTQQILHTNKNINA